MRGMPRMPRRAFWGLWGHCGLDMSGITKQKSITQQGQKLYFPQNLYIALKLGIILNSSLFFVYFFLITNISPVKKSFKIHKKHLKSAVILTFRENFRMQYYGYFLRKF